MKFSKNHACYLSAAFVLSLSSCKKAEKSAAPSEENPPAAELIKETPKQATAQKATISLSPEERATKLGFAQYLPADTEMMMSVYNAEEATEAVKALKLVEVISSLNSAGFSVDEEFDEEMIEEDAEQAKEIENEEIPEGEMSQRPNPWALLGREITIGLGKTSGKQLGQLSNLNSRTGYFQARAFGKAAQTFAKSGNQKDFAKVMVDELAAPEMMKFLVQDSESGLKLWEQTSMPPVYIAFRAKEGEVASATQLLSGSMAMMAMAGEMVAPTEVKAGGQTFGGYKILGEQVAKMMNASKESLEPMLGKENFSRFMEILAKKNLVIATGSIGEYAVLMMGDSEESFQLTNDIKQSIVSGDSLKFTDNFASKKLISVIQGNQHFLNDLSYKVSGIGAYALGLRDGISSGGGISQTSELEAILQIISDREKELFALSNNMDGGLIAYSEDGLKIETFGGADSGATNWNVKNQLAHLANQEDQFLFYNGTSNSEYSKKMSAYLEAITQSIYSLSEKFNEMNIEDPELEKMHQFSQVFASQFRGDLVGIYGALNGSLAQGLGEETAVVIDLDGSMPAVPGLPQAVVDQLKAPRYTMICPVTDRTQIAKSWTEINTRATNLVATASELIGEKIPMQKPISSEKDGMTTWFISLPFFQDDFLPSVTLNDQLFAVSTSKTRAVELLGKAKAGGATSPGETFHMNFTKLTKYLSDSLAVVDKNSAELFKGKEKELETFNENKKSLKDIIDAFDDFKSISVKSQLENEIVHSHIHLKVNNSR